MLIVQLPNTDVVNGTLMSAVLPGALKCPATKSPLKACDCTARGQPVTPAPQPSAVLQIVYAMPAWLPDCGGRHAVRPSTWLRMRARKSVVVIALDQQLSNPW